MGWAWGLKKFSSFPPEIEFQVIEMDAGLFFCTERVLPYKEMEKWNDFRLESEIQQGISPEFFFTGVCYGGLITLSLQLALGLFLRERPLFALATVATAVGIWTVTPYAVATGTALFIYLRHRYST